MTEDNIEELLESNSDLKVLYAEDNEFVRENTVLILEKFFSNIDEAIDGKDGLDKYKSYYEKNAKNYDIVITDISMPRMGGIEMCEHILRLNEGQKILVISAHNESNKLLKLINLGISNFAIKPLDVSQLKKKIIKIIKLIANKKVIKKQYDAIRDMNATLREAKIVAERASEKKSEFLANMSHEIRTPLNAIVGFISLLSEEETDAKKFKYLGIIKESSDSLLQIINDILDISKI